MSFLHKSISIGCIVTILVGIPLTSCTQLSQMQTQLMSPEALLKRGQEKSQKGSLQEAIADFTEVIRRNPNNADAYTYRGKARLGGDYQGAIADFTEAIRINPKNAEAYLNRAQLYICRLASDISSLDGSPAYLWEDGESGTSSKIVYNLENYVLEEKSLDASTFGKVVLACESLGLNLRLWWANNSPDAFTDVACVKTMAEASSIISRQACSCDVIGLLFNPNRGDVTHTFP